MIAVIEMPKGETVRRHKDKHGEGLIELGLIKDAIPVNGGVNPVHYGYIPDTHNPSDDDELDVIVISKEADAIGQEVAVTPIALLRRADHDDKIVAVPEDEKEISSWEDVEQGERDLILQFYSFHHAITAIENSAKASEYIEKVKNHIDM